MIESLTDRERDALRLYNDLNSAKEVAKRLNISHHTVYDRLASARTKLGAPTSMAAARALVAAEAASQSFGYEGIGIAPQALPAPHSLVSRLLSPLVARGAPENDLRFDEKLIAVGGIAMMMMMAAALYFLAFGVFSSAIGRS